MRESKDIDDDGLTDNPEAYQAALDDIRNRLLTAGVCVGDPVAAVVRMLTERACTDWRDAFLAALAGGHSVRMAHAMADEAEDVMRAKVSRRAEQQAVKS